MAYPDFLFRVNYWIAAMLLTLGVTALLYVPYGIGVSAMAKKLGIAHPHGAYIPLYRHKKLGDVAAECSCLNDGKRRNYGKILMWLSSLGFAAVLLLSIAAALFAVFGIAGDGNGGILPGNSLAAFIAFIATLVLLPVSAALCAAACVAEYISYYRIYKHFAGTGAVFLLVLTVLLIPAGPVILLVLSCGTPAASDGNSM